MKSGETWRAGKKDSASHLQWKDLDGMGKKKKVFVGEKINIFNY